MYLIWMLFFYNLGCVLTQYIKESQKVTPLLTGTSATPIAEEETIGALSRKKCLEYTSRRLVQTPTLVIGGQPALLGEFTHMAIIGFGEVKEIEWACGGALISERFILTAAHCLYSKKFDRPRWVRLGDLDLKSDSDDAFQRYFRVNEVITHPLYKPPVKYHDIGLIDLGLNVEILMSINALPGCLNTHRDFHKTSLTATGWGNTEFIGSPSNFLLKVDLDYVPYEKCKSHFEISPSILPNGIVDDWQICAGGAGKDTCQRDSGGPLQVKNTERSDLLNSHTIVGITSFGKPCGLTDSPAIYTRVSHYVPWIESIVWPNETITR